MLNGWKAIAAYLRRDERTAMRWATDRGMPVHRTPGPGRGSVYALSDEIDAWLEDDRGRLTEISPALPTLIDTTEPPVVQLSRIPWWRRYWTAGGLIGAGVVLATIGAVSLHFPLSRIAARSPQYKDPATNALFLQASYDWNLRTPESLSRAVQEYSDTIGRDPRMPQAYVGLANSYLLLREYSMLPDPEAYDRAEAAARAAIAIEPDCAEAHRALAFIDFWWRQDRTAARREFQRALSLKPDDALTHHWLANALLANGEYSSALREINEARDLDPTATSIVADRAAILYFAGNRTLGLDGLRRLAREQPDALGPHRAIAEIALYEGRVDEFLQEATITARLRSDTVGLAKAEHWQSARVTAQGLEELMLRDAQASHTDWFVIATLSALANRRQDASNALTTACKAHEPSAISAPSNLWLSRVLTRADIIERCGRTLPLS